MSEPRPDNCNSLTQPIPVALPSEFPGAEWYGDEEIEAVTRVIRNRSPFRYYGPKWGGEVASLEREFARFLSSQPGEPWPDETDLRVTAVNSGTGALEVALDAMGVGQGDEMLVQGFMWISSISAIVRSRAIPVLVDSDETLNMDPASIRQRVTPRTKVIMPVPMLGGCARIGAIMDEVRAINAERARQGLPRIQVLEDCAQSLGAHAQGVPGSRVALGPPRIHRVGTFGDAGIFSLQINKNITAGEGGMVVTRDPELARRIESLHNAGYVRDSAQPKYWYGDSPLGWGHGRRMTELQGAVARVQLKRLDDILRRMRHSHDRIESYLRSLGLTPRARADADNPGDTGYYCLFHLPPSQRTDAERIKHGRAVAAALGEFGLRPWFMHDFEVHVYYNIQPLVEKWPLNNGGPWEAGTQASGWHTYHRGMLPRLDELLATTVGVNVPSRLSEADEEYIKSALGYVNTAVIQRL